MLRNFVITVFLSLWVSIGIAAEETRVQALRLPSHGVLNFTVPASWKSDIEQPSDNLPPTITFSQANGATFRVLVTPLWQFSSDTPLPEGDSLQKLVQRASEEIQKSAANKITVQHLGDSGYYYFAVDPAPKPGEWALMTQGMVRKGVLILNFTVLTNNGQEQTSAQALQAIETAVHVAP